MQMYVRAMLSFFLAAALPACAGDEPVEEPVPVEGESPFEYPLSLWDEGAEGAPLLMVRVTEAGAVDSAYVEQTSGYEAFDSAAVAGARELRFRPARRGGEPIQRWVQLPVRFVRPESRPTRP